MKLTRRGKALGITVAVLATVAVGCSLPLPPAGMSLPPCAQEDSVPPGGCSWDASERGNGAGADFWVIQDSQRGVCYTYPDHVGMNVCIPPNHP